VTSHQKYVCIAIDHLHGERNGKRIGKKLNIVAKLVKKRNFNYFLI